MRKAFAKLSSWWVRRFHTTYEVVLVELFVRYKSEVPDPEKKDLLASLQGLGYSQVTSVGTAKYFRLKFRDSSLTQARADAHAFGEILLANPVTENFEILSVAAINP